MELANLEFRRLFNVSRQAETSFFKELLNEQGVLQAHSTKDGSDQQQSQNGNDLNNFTFKLNGPLQKPAKVEFSVLEAIEKQQSESFLVNVNHVVPFY